ncbi:MAG: mercuric transporter MerT family protein [Mariprofundaceae bacterium]|nr:mercuric transporter MerT family protein [Mariprofundaceae bacterium]
MSYSEIFGRNMMKNIQTKKENRPLIGAIVAGGLASACCIGPLIVVMLGLGSASAFIAMEPYRPIFAVLTIALIVWAGRRHWQGRKICIANGCPPKKPVLLWGLGGFAVLLLISPSLLPYFIK